MLLFLSLGRQCAQCAHEACRRLREARASFHSNMPWALPARLRSRGLQAALSEEEALFGAWRLQKGPPSRRGGGAQSRQALIELRPIGACAELGDKKRLAMFLERCGLCMWSPLTAVTMRDMASFVPSDGGPVLWFLKHARKQRNEGVSVHLGAQECQRAWLSVSPDEQDDYIAQQEVPSVLLDNAGRKMTFRIYLLMMSRLRETSSSALALARREFICRSHPAPYDPMDPDAARHVHSTLDVFEGVQGRSSRAFAQAEEVWPAVLSMFKVGRQSAQSESLLELLTCMTPTQKAVLEPFLESFATACHAGRLWQL